MAITTSSAIPDFEEPGVPVPAASLLTVIPSKVEGIDRVHKIIVHPDQLEIYRSESTLRINFAQIARPQGSVFYRFMQRAIGKTLPSLVADRNFFARPNERWFAFYTEPELRIFMPDDESKEYPASYFFRIQQVIRSGGYETYDCG